MARDRSDTADDPPRETSPRDPLVTVERASASHDCLGDVSTNVDDGSNDYDGDGDHE